MSEQRRHQRIRFNLPPRIRLGKFGQLGLGELENLSLSGLMLRTELLLSIGESFGCEFSVFGSPLIDMPAVVVSKFGDLYGARFQAGPISALLIQDAIENAVASGKASILSIHDLEGRKVMRIAGGLNSCLRSDFMHGLKRVGVAELDLAGVTDIDSVGLALCLIAVEQYQVALPKCSPCVEAAWTQAGPPMAKGLAKSKEK
jgi:PilZ domain